MTLSQDSWIALPFGEPVATFPPESKSKPPKPIRDELIETAHWLQEKRRLREERMKTRVRCPYCKERVGKCKAKKPN